MLRLPRSAKGGFVIPNTSQTGEFQFRWISLSLGRACEPGERTYYLNPVISAFVTVQLSKIFAEFKAFYQLQYNYPIIKAEAPAYVVTIARHPIKLFH